MKMKILLAVLFFIILIQGYILIFKNESVQIELFDDSALRKEIELADSLTLSWQNKALNWKRMAINAEKYSDSLENLKPLIQYHYDTVYKFIPNGTTIQLDSIIRANW